MRPYRKLMASCNQTSPLGIIEMASRVLKGQTIADVGCGSGAHSYYLSCLNGLSSITAIDFSQQAVSKLKNRGTHDQVYLASSNTLPLPDKSVDCALSLENLEHLYANQVIPAIRELKRIASKQVIISTPWPETCINTRFLREEITEASADNQALDYKEFTKLVGFVHKSILCPDSMIAAGFTNPIKYNSLYADTALYVAETNNIDIEKIKVVGLKEPTHAPSSDMRKNYLELLNGSLMLKSNIPKSQRYKKVRLFELARLLNKGFISLKAILSLKVY